MIKTTITALLLFYLSLFKIPSKVWMKSKYFEKNLYEIENIIA